MRQSPWIVRFKYIMSPIYLYRWKLSQSAYTCTRCIICVYLMQMYMYISSLPCEITCHTHCESKTALWTFHTLPPALCKYWRLVSLTLSSYAGVFVRSALWNQHRRLSVVTVPQWRRLQRRYQWVPVRLLQHRYWPSFFAVCDCCVHLEWIR